jgi:hypothetical protein
VSGVVVVKAVLVAGVLFTFLATILTIDYRITPAALEIRILGATLRRILLTDIEEVHRRGAFLHEGWTGPKFWNAVTVRRRSGLLRNLVISPDDPDRFAEEIRLAVERATGSTPPR